MSNKRKIEKSNEDKQTSTQDVPTWITRMKEKAPTVIFKG